MFVPVRNKDGKRFYGSWAGRPNGQPEDYTRCIAEVANPPSWVGKQCSRKRGHGPKGEFCTQHAKRHVMIAELKD